MATAILAALALCAVIAGAAEAALPPIKVRVPRAPVPTPVLRDLEATAGAANRYGADPLAVAALDEAAARVGDDVDATAARVRADAEGAVTIRQCTGAGLQSAGESYRDAIAEASEFGGAVPSPDHEQAISAVSGCLQEYFPNTPDELTQVAEYLVAQAFERADEAAQADGSAEVLANWMTVTGSDLAAAEETASADPVAAPPAGGSSPSSGSADDGGGVPWGVVIPIGLAALAIGVGYAVKHSGAP